MFAFMKQRQLLFSAALMSPVLFMTGSAIDEANKKEEESNLEFDVR